MQDIGPNKKILKTLKNENTKLMVESKLLSIRIFLLKVILKNGQKKYLLPILF